MFNVCTYAYNNSCKNICEISSFYHFKSWLNFAIEITGKHNYSVIIISNKIYKSGKITENFSYYINQCALRLLLNKRKQFRP